jgi:hypothetical protein
MTPRNASSGGAIPGGKTSYSPDLLTAAAAGWASAVCAASPPKATYQPGPAYTATCASYAGTTAFSRTRPGVAVRARTAPGEYVRGTPARAL